MAIVLAGKYDFDSAENIDEYLKGLGVGLVLRKVQSVAKPSLEISFSPDTEEWLLKTESVFKTHALRFKEGLSVEDETYDARKCRTVGMVDGEKLVLEQECDEGPKVTIMNELTGDGLLKMTFTAGDYCTTHIYRKKENEG